VIACGAPNFSRIRWANALKAQSTRSSDCPHRRNTRATRLALGRILPLLPLVRPPVLLTPGQSDNQLQKCLSVSQRLMSVPISGTICNAVYGLTPSMDFTSRPVTRNNEAGTSNRGSCRPFCRLGLLGVGSRSPADRSVWVAKYVSIRWSTSAIFCLGSGRQCNLLGGAGRGCRGPRLQLETWLATEHNTSSRLSPRRNHL